MNYFCPPDPNRKDAKEFHVEFRTNPELEHSRILATAQKVHDIRPDLVTDEDLATIGRLRASYIEEYSRNPREKKPEVKSEAQTAVLVRLPPLDASRLDRLGNVAWGERDFSSEEHGVFVHIVKEQEKDGLTRFWRARGYEIIESAWNSGIKWFQLLDTQPEKAVLYRFRLAPATMSYLVTSADPPGDIRWFALREMHRVEGYAEGERLRLIELASRDRDPRIRYLAVENAWQYKPLTESIPILCRALCDPDIRVSHPACDPVINYFFPKPYDDEFRKTPYYAGHAADLARHDEVAAVAQKVHEVRPELVTDADLATIHALRDSRAPEEDRKAKTP